MLGFAFLAMVLAGIFAPGMISWYFTPPTDLAFNCKPALEWGISTYQKALLGSGIGGAIIGLVIGALIARRRPVTVNVPK